MMNSKVFRNVSVAAGLGVCCALAPFAAASAADGTPSLGIVNFDSTSLTANSFAVSLEKATKALDWDVVVQDPKGDLAQANTLCTQYVTRKVDAIAVNIFESSQMAQCMAYAQAASIPVFFIGSTLAKGMAGAVDTIVAGPINDAFMEYASGQENLQVLALTYNPGAPCRVREEVFDADVAAAANEITVTKHEITIPGQVTTALAATQAWLNGHPADKGENLAVWACYSDPAYGALSAMKQAGRTGIPIYTWDLTKQVVDSIKSGEMDATLWIDSDGLAQQMIAQIKDILAGGEPREDAAASVVITPENIEGFLKDHPEALP